MTKGYSINKGRVTGTAASRLKGQSVSFVRVGRTVMFDGPETLLPKTVKAEVLSRVGL